MFTQKFELREKPTEHGFMPTVTFYIIDRWKKPCARPMVIVVPGGGYGGVCSDREGERIALAYNAAGFHTAILQYAVSPHVFPEALLNIAAAVRIAREHAEEWQASKDMIAVCGFSAGAHLCGSLATMWNDPTIFSEETIASRICRPDASILCYPVITGVDKCHLHSFERLYGSQQVPHDFLEKNSLELRVSSDTCPAFIWSTFSDQIVPVESSLLYASALRKNNVPFELHIYPNGVHGLALQSDEVIWSKPDRGRDYHWMDLSVDWLNELFKTTEK
ncbi:MAG: alpha/beta hydrolase [Clostridia bacterium]|nr:alpha/beta hydrolase [Clostridia bacterium]